MSRATKNSMRIVCFTGLLLIIIMFVLVASRRSQAQKPADTTEAPIPVEIKRAVEILPDSLLPDTTKAKIALLAVKLAELKTANEKDSIKAINEAIAAKKEKKLAEFVSSKVSVPEIATPEIKSTHPPYPDSLIIIHKLETKKRHKKR